MAFAQDYAARVQAHNGVHIPRDLELLQRFDACLGAELDVHHGLQDVLTELDTGMRERDPLERHQLALL